MQVLDEVDDSLKERQFDLEHDRALVETMHDRSLVETMLANMNQKIEELYRQREVIEKAKQILKDSGEY